jgi:hypothetical protein
MNSLINSKKLLSINDEVSAVAKTVTNTVLEIANEIKSSIGKNC